jgi:ribose/xylose/arabinose/galactoside ABC-type transport system permease subunit
VTVEQSKRSRRRIALPAETGVGVVLTIAVLWLGRTFPNFNRTDNWNAILSAGAEVAIVAAGMTLVIATGGIDISVGSIIGLSGIVLGLLYKDHHWNIWFACAAALAAGAGCGLINGILIARFKVPPIIATLAMFSAARAGAYVLSNGNSIGGLPDSIITVGYGKFPAEYGLPIPAWIAGFALIAVGTILKRSAFGRSVKALGGNRESSFLSGIRTGRVESLVYVISGLLAGLSAVVVTARGATAIPDAGKFFELRAITAVVLGGTSVAGGRATIVGTALGLLTIGVVANGVRSYGKAGIWEQLVLGIVLLAAVEVDRWRTRRNQS